MDLWLENVTACESLTSVTSISCIVADPLEELIWTGNSRGQINAYQSDTLSRVVAAQPFYTQMQLQIQRDAEQRAKRDMTILPPLCDIRSMFLDDRAVYSLCPTGVAICFRGGHVRKVFEDPAFVDLQCMIRTSPNAQSILLGGLQPSLLMMDINRGVVTKQIEAPSGVVLLKQSKLFCCGASNGTIELRDPKSLVVEHSIKAHSGGLSDMDVAGSLLATCGFTDRGGQYSPDPFVKLWDLRMIKPNAPVQISGQPPALVRFLPKYSAKLCVAAQTGPFYSVTAHGATSAMTVGHVNLQGGVLTCMDMSSSCEMAVFGDSMGIIHQWVPGALAEPPRVNVHSRPTLLPEGDTLMLPTAVLDFDDTSVPLSAVGMPLTRDKLLSDWPADKAVRLFRPKVIIADSILQSIRTADFVSYIKAPPGQKRNVIGYPRQYWKLGTSDASKQAVTVSKKRNPNVPEHYHRVEIQYSKLGLQEFDFGKYNLTRFSGLEPHIPNAYCNALLQALYFCAPTKLMLQEHLCRNEFCLSCELGFLFHMLSTAKSQSCQASNFLRSFRTMPHAVALRLVLGDDIQANLEANFPRIIQSFNRFLLAKIDKETQTSKGKDSVAYTVYGATTVTTTKCNHCQTQEVLEAPMFLFDLVYPTEFKGSVNQFTFGSLLRSAILREQTLKCFCPVCKSNQIHCQHKNIITLPQVLNINCALDKEADLAFWESKTKEFMNEQKAKAAANPDLKPLVSWIPLGVRITLNKNGSECDVQEFFNRQEMNAAIALLDPADKLTQIYCLKSNVAHISDSSSGGNLVSHIRVDSQYHLKVGTPKAERKEWYLFNDFSIAPVEEADALTFDLKWKTPCIFFFERPGLGADYDREVKFPYDDWVFNDAVPLPRRPRGPKPPTAVVALGKDELPFRDKQLVAIDAEFVSLHQEEKIFRSDGSKSTLKLAQMACARVTVVRGGPPHEGAPFIDDYIQNNEEVADYLTKFSGIMPGDLDAQHSSKHVTSLKTMYLKLRRLADCGVIFIGHGLTQDFRVINLKIPDHQVVDTVELFRAGKRKISLRFLAWAVLNMDIQSANHDSIEDARAALLLYKKYLQLKEEGSFETVLAGVYEKGHACNWKAPHWAVTE